MKLINEQVKYKTLGAGEITSFDGSKDCISTCG